MKIDKEALVTFLTLRYNPAPKTLIKDIHKLRPGDLFEFNIITGSFKKVFNINEHRIPEIKILRAKSEDYWVNLLSETLEEAIKRQMLSDVEVGVFLSGGLDSALITALASKYTNGKFKTFCIGFEEASKREDETQDARRTAEILGTEYYEVKISADKYFDFINQSISILEEPNGTAPTLAQYEVSKLASKYVKVALAGQGADEIFMGYLRYKAEFLRKKYFGF